MTRCPMCFAEVLATQISFRCNNPGCATQPDPRLSEQLGMPVMGRAVMQVTPRPGWDPTEGVPCTACNERTAVEVCGRCHYAFMPGWRNGTTTCIALSGARNSGKSIYIALLVKQLELWTERMGMAMMPAPGATAETYRVHYEEPLFKARGLLQATPPAKTGTQASTPLIYRLGVFRGVTHHVVIRDTAGEDLETPGLDVGPFSFFTRADAVFFLFDPLRIPAVRQQLAGVTADEQRLDGGDPVEVLGNVIRIMTGGAVVTGRIPTKLAVVLAKFDALAQLKDVKDSPMAAVMDNLGASFNRDLSLEPTFDVRDTMLVNLETRSLLTKLNANKFLNHIDASFAEHHAFAVSALGLPPATATEVNRSGMAPQRVLDPLKWAMAKAGTIDAVNQ